MVSPQPPESRECGAQLERARWIDLERELEGGPHIVVLRLEPISTAALATSPERRLDRGGKTEVMVQMPLAQSRVLACLEKTFLRKLSQRLEESVAGGPSSRF